MKIKWSSKLVDVASIKPTPTNYKIKTELGQERLKQSLKMFGLAGNVVVNPDGKGYVLIDGNSRLIEAKEAKEKKIWVSVPNRRLTPKEFKQMSAMFDFAKAGEVDTERIFKDLGTSKDFYNAWSVEVPMEILDKIGKHTKVDIKEFPDSKKTKGTDSAGAANVMMIQLFLTSKQEALFRKQEEKLAKKFKTDNITDTVFKAFMSIK